MALLAIEIPDEIQPAQAREIAEILCDTIVRLQHRGLTMANIVPLLRTTAATLENADHDPILELKAKAQEYAFIEVEISVDQNITMNESKEEEELPDLRSLIQELPEIRALDRFERRIPEFTWAPDNWRDADLNTLFTRTIDGIDTYEEAFVAVQTLAKDSGTPMIMSRDAWRTTASDDQLDREDKDFFFFEDIDQLTIPFKLTQLIEFVVITAGIRRRSDILDHIKDRLSDRLEQIDTMETKLDDVIDAVSRYPALVQGIDEIARGSVVPMTDFVASLQMPHQLTTAWINEALEDGRIAKIKKGRWLLVSAARQP